MKKIIILSILLIILSGCTKKNSIVISNDEIKRTEHTYEDMEGLCGYIVGFDGEKVLVVGENVTDEDNSHLNATKLNIKYQDLIDNTIEIGTKVRYVSHGLAHTTYPLLGGLKVIEIIDHEYSDSTSLSKDVIKKVIEALDDIKGNDEYWLYCINDIIYDCGSWQVKVVVDSSIQDYLKDYLIYVEDKTLEVTEIIYYESILE